MSTDKVFTTFLFSYELYINYEEISQNQQSKSVGKFNGLASLFSGMLVIVQKAGPCKLNREINLRRMAC